MVSANETTELCCTDKKIDFCMTLERVVIYDQRAFVRLASDKVKTSIHPS